VPLVTSDRALLGRQFHQSRYLKYSLISYHGYVQEQNGILTSVTSILTGMGRDVVLIFCETARRATKCATCLSCLPPERISGILGDGRFDRKSTGNRRPGGAGGDIGRRSPRTRSLEEVERRRLEHHVELVDAIAHRHSARRLAALRIADNAPTRRGFIVSPT